MVRCKLVTALRLARLARATWTSYAAQLVVPRKRQGDARSVLWGAVLGAYARAVLALRFVLGGWPGDVGNAWCGALEMFQLPLVLTLEMFQPLVGDAWCGALNFVVVAVATSLHRLSRCAAAHRVQGVDRCARGPWIIPFLKPTGRSYVTQFRYQFYIVFL